MNEAVHDGTASHFGLACVCVGTQLSREGWGGEGAPPFQALSV